MTPHLIAPGALQMGAVMAHEQPVGPPSVWDDPATSNVHGAVDRARNVRSSAAEQRIIAQDRRSDALRECARAAALRREGFTAIEPSAR